MRLSYLHLLLFLFAVGCGDDVSSGRVDIHVNRDKCGESCLDRFDLFILQGSSCVFAWRVDMGGKTQSMSQLEIGGQVTVEVLGQCGADNCPRCSARQSFTVGSRERVDLMLQKVASCTVSGRVTTPCSRCLPGPDAYCDGAHRVTCPASGQTNKESCSHGCESGVCLDPCAQKKIYYRDKDGDTWGDNTAQKEACSRPAGYADRGGDCNDEDERAYPGQTAWFTEPTKGKGGFDYNCDNVETRQYPKLDNCVFDSKTNTCSGIGWIAFVPGCGGVSGSVGCMKDIPTGCKAGMPGFATQPCH